MSIVTVVVYCTSIIRMITRIRTACDIYVQCFLSENLLGFPQIEVPLMLNHLDLQKRVWPGILKELVSYIHIYVYLCTYIP